MLQAPPLPSSVKGRPSPPPSLSPALPGRLSPLYPNPILRHCASHIHTSPSPPLGRGHRRGLLRSLSVIGSSARALARGQRRELLLGMALHVAGRVALSLGWGAAYGGAVPRELCRVVTVARPPWVGARGGRGREAGEVGETGETGRRVPSMVPLSVYIEEGIADPFPPPLPSPSLPLRLVAGPPMLLLSGQFPVQFPVPPRSKPPMSWPYDENSSSRHYLSPSVNRHRLRAENEFSFQFNFQLGMGGVRERCALP